MSNFTFSESLELSIIEHRMVSLFEMLDEVENPLFFPSLLFNETFWMLQFEKKLSILTFSAHDWLGQNPEHRSYLYKDSFYLDLMRSIKVSSLPYSKVTLTNLLDLLKIKNNFVLSEFKSFGDAENGPIKVLNQVSQKFVAQNDIPASVFDPELIAKISAVKFYTRFVKNKEVQGVTISLRGREKYWDSFFKSLNTLDVKQGTKLLEKLHFYFLGESQFVIDQFIENIPEYPSLKQFHDNGQIQFDIFNPDTFDPNQKIDYLHATYALSKLPTEILIKFSNGIYHAVGRIAYTDRRNDRDAVEKLNLYQSPINIGEKVAAEELDKLDFEIILEPYENQNAINLIEQNYDFIERSTLRFSVSIFNFLVKAIKSLSTNGYMELWDLNETRRSNQSLTLFRNEYREAMCFVNFKMYLNILNSFSDMSFTSSVRTVQDVLAHELMSGREKVIPLDWIFKYITEKTEVAKKFFSIQNLTFVSELQKIHKSVEFFEMLKKRKIMMLGVPTLLYSLGFRSFKQKVIANEVLINAIEKDQFRNNRLKSYVEEYTSALIPRVLQTVALSRDVMVSRESSAKINQEFYEVLDRLGMDRESVMTLLNEEWGNILDFSESITNFTLLEISTK